MNSPCVHADCVSKTIHVRNVPDVVYRKLEVRAAEAGKSLSEYLLEELRSLSEVPTMEEMAQRLGPARG